MTGGVALGVLAAWWLQSAALVAAVALLARATRCRAPRALAALWAAVLASALALPAVQSLAPLPAAPRAALTLDAVVTAGAARTGPLSWAAILLLALATVSVSRLVRLALRQRRLRHWALAGTPYSDDALPRGLLASAAGPEIRTCDRVDAPATFGDRRPVILLPDAFPREAWHRRRDALVHELLHVQRRDWRQAIAEEILAEALWFQPAIRFAVGERRVAREQVVDAEVVALTGDRRGYACTLVALASAHLRPVLASMAASGLERRIDLLTKEEPMTRSRTILSMAATTAAAVAVSAVMALAVPLPGTARKDGPAAATAAERKALRRVNPVYPAAAKERGIQGDVEVDVLVNAAGEVTEAKVLDGPIELRDPTLAAARQWRFAAGDATRLTLTFRFSLLKDE
ncbi:MAG TPA: M56 family metallopeptidase [Vicinamibacteria bacterium]|nr:M56 family metallopeptidase [Vicinamibacteria bacterium]